VLLNVWNVQRIDESTDKGPAHLEIQFWWTLRHLQRPTFATLLTTRSSGASYLNRVELQNGWCLSLGHSNSFIPSNLNGSCFDPGTGQLDHQRLQANMDLATDIYIRRRDGAPCGSASIHLFKGADSSTHHELSTHVLTILKGSQTQKKQLMQEKSEVMLLRRSGR